jgi:predicted CoA-substrate-specific enzyme activase
VPAIAALGIDAGSTTVKLAAVDGAGALVWQALEPAEPRVAAQVERLLAGAAAALGPLDGLPLVATGYGRGLVAAAGRRVTEITCHARGVHRVRPGAGTLVDLGGQDSKVIAITAAGDVLDFAMNDKCAAGTGRFLENTARRLAVPLGELGPLALGAGDEVAVSSTCTVFAESEVVSLLAEGVALEAILRGLHRALARRVAALMRQVQAAPDGDAPDGAAPLILTGGVARNSAICRLLAEETGRGVVVPDDPQIIGAYGAALLGLAG